MRDGRYVVIIVDDHPLFAEGLALLLDSRAGAWLVITSSAPPAAPHRS